MPRYVVETYLAHGQAGDHLVHEARAVAAELTRAGDTVRLEFALHVPEDEMCFFVFEAPSAHQSALAAQRAGLEPIRVVEAFTSGVTEL